MENNNEHWHLDKRVPISLILVIVIQTAGVIWFASELASRVDANTNAIARLAQTSEAQDERVRSNTTSVAVIKETLQSTKDALERIDRRLESIDKKLTDETK